LVVFWLTGGSHFKKNIQAVEVKREQISELFFCLTILLVGW